MTPEVNKAALETRAAHSSVQNAISVLFAAERRDLSNVSKVVALRGVYDTVQAARQAQDELLAALGIQEGLPEVIEHQETWPPENPYDA